jgi:hypothetical protein
MLLRSSGGWCQTRAYSFYEAAATSMASRGESWKTAKRRPIIFYEAAARWRKICRLLRTQDPSTKQRRSLASGFPVEDV